MLLFFQSEQLVEEEAYPVKKRLPSEKFQWQSRIQSINASKIKTCRNSVQGKELIADDRGRQGVTQDLETGGQNWGFLKFRGSKVSYLIYKNDHSNLIYWLSKTKCASLCHSMYLLSSRSETFEIFPWTLTNTENLAKYNWVSFSQKSCVWESKWLPGGCLGKSLEVGVNWNIRPKKRCLLFPVTLP